MSADRVAVLDQGHVAAAGTPAETVTDEVLARVFKCSLSVRRAPPPGVSYVLPHTAIRTAH